MCGMLDLSMDILCINVKKNHSESGTELEFSNKALLLKYRSTLKFGDSKFDIELCE